MVLSVPSGHENRAQSSTSVVSHTKHLSATNPSRPSHHNRTLSSPPLSPLQTSQDAAARRPCNPVTNKTNSPLTPPATPRQTKSSTDSASITTQSHEVALQPHNTSPDGHSPPGAAVSDEASGSSGLI